MSFLILAASFAVDLVLQAARPGRGLRRGEEDDTLQPEVLEPRPERPDRERGVRARARLDPASGGAWRSSRSGSALRPRRDGAVRRRSIPIRVRLAEEVADVLDDSLDDLRAEPDARRAVIAAYARLERTFAASGLAALRQETAEEYVSRILGKLEVDGRLVRRLADLFTRGEVLAPRAWTRR